MIGTVVGGMFLISFGMAQQGTTVRVSVSSSGAQGNSDSGSDYSVKSMSADGRYVAFSSIATNLVPGDSNGRQDVFVRDRLAGTTERVSMSSSGKQGNLDSGLRGVSISADGRYVAFESAATNLVAGSHDGSDDVILRDRLLGTTERISVSSSGTPGNYGSYYPSVSADGRYVAFWSYATNLVADYTNPASAQVFVRDRLAGTTELVSVSSAGVQGNGYSGYYMNVSISADGRYVAFSSLANNLVSGDTNASWDVFVRDRLEGTPERVSVSTAGVQGNGDSSSNGSGVSISADGRFVAFQSAASNLVAGDWNGSGDVFVRDRLAGTTELVSVSSAGVQGNWSSSEPSISADGHNVAFTSYSTNLVSEPDTNNNLDVFVRDRETRTTQRVSVSSSGVQGNSASDRTFISADGRYVAFESYANNLVVGDTNAATDVFVHRTSSSPGSGSTYLRIYIGH
jgi:hypothetical protein